MLIFGLAMFQVGHNLVRATTYKGKPIDPTLQLSLPAERTYDWALPPRNMATAGASRYMGNRRICTSGDYLYAVEPVTQNPNESVQAFDGLLDICRFPAATGKAIILSRTRFAVTPPLSSTMHSGLTICTLLLRENLLFVGYQVCIATGQPADDANAAEAAGRAGPTAVSPPDTYSLRMLVVDVSDPAAPKRIADEDLEQSQTPIFQNKGQSCYGDFCYIFGQKQLLVVSLSDPVRPVVARKIALSDLGMNENHPLLIEQASVSGDRLLCVGPQVLLLMDLADSTSPKMVFRRIDMTARWNEDSVRAALYANDLLYLSTMTSLEIHRLSPTPTGQYRDELLGRRHTTPLERLAGKSPGELMLRQGYLYEADGRFGMLVYDVSDPTRPYRSYHAANNGQITSLGDWQGLLYMSSTDGQLTLVAMP